MLIWRGLQPKVMAQLMVGIAQARQDARAGATAAATKAPQPSLPAQDGIKKG